ncbi:hypothetical protein [Vibrio sp. D431a]|uniref:hypothetical protein n=1 Tax=Vibrio sp. D431a TaxID=2837388 RepID=UPI0025525485|nr:hypothetical protein [Vibrio sp. D431a]MDK9790624.1 hypothetical protein [Vibrio sp. D431a]
MSEKKEVFIIEKELKQRLAFQCVHAVKQYAKEKQEKTKSRELKTMLRNFISNVDFNYSFGLHLSILFSYDYALIKEKVINKEFSLKHISEEKYWLDKGHHIDREEAIFFIYTFFNELYPNTIDDINWIQSEMDKGRYILDLIKESELRFAKEIGESA